MTLILQLQLAAIPLIGLALLHFVLPRKFNWKDELPRLGLFNRQMLVVHAVFIALICLLMGLLLISSAEDLVTTRLGKRVLIGFAIFWTLRLFVQFFGYSRELWKGKPFETATHFAFGALWIWLAGLFGYAAYVAGP